MGRELRSAISTVLEGVAGPSPRPTRVSRAIGLDKSLASRLVRAVRSTSDMELMHLVPSPGGLHTAELATRYSRPRLDRQPADGHGRPELLDAVPGGRASIDAQISVPPSRFSAVHAAGVVRPSFLRHLRKPPDLSFPCQRETRGGIEGTAVGLRAP
jgi:hypothetical protein